MPLRKLDGLKARLFGIVMLAMLPVLSLALYMAYGDHDAAKAAAVEKSRRLTRAYAARGESLIDAARQALDQAAKPAPAALPGSACERLLASLGQQRSFFLSAALYRADGALLCASPSDVATLPAAQQGWLREALKGRGLVIGQYLPQLSGGRGALPLALALAAPSPAGGDSAVLCLYLGLDSLGEILDDDPLPAGAAVSILDRSGTILARYPQEASAVGRSAPGSERFMPQLLRQGLDAWSDTGVDGVERQYFLSPLAGAGDSALFLRLGLPTENVFADANRALKRNLGFIVAMTCVVLLSTWFFSTALVLRHVNRLLLATRKLTEGDFDHRIGPAGGGELGALALAFDNMADALEDRTDQLSAAERKYRDIFENSVAGIFRTTPEGVFHEVNGTMARLLGYGKPDECKSRVQDIGKDVYAEPQLRAMLLDRLDREGSVTGFEFPAKHAGGHHVWLSMDARAVRGEDGQVLCYEGMVSEVTQRRRMEQELKSKQEKLQALLDYSPALISIKDAQGRYLLSNRRHQEVRRLEPSVLGRGVEELFPQDVALRIMEEDREVLALGRPVTYQRALRHDGEERHFVTVKFPLYDDQGRPDRVGAISHDVTDLERVREALRQSEEKFRTMIQTSPDLIWLIDPVGVLVEVNSASRELIGYEPEELRGRHFHCFFHPEDLLGHDRDKALPQLLGSNSPQHAHPKLINERRQLPRSTRNLNLRLIPKKGIEHPPRDFELSSCGLWQDMEFQGTIVVIHDITERRRAEAALRQSRELLAQTQAMARIGGWTVDLDTRQWSWTDMAGELLGLKGAVPDLFESQDFLAPEERETFRQALAWAAEYGEGFDLELRLAPDAGPQAWVRIMGRRTAEDGTLQLSGTVQDITDRKALEQLHADIDSIIRHDLKTPLNGIINLPQLMKSDENLTEGQVEFLQFIEDAGRNMLRQIDMSLVIMKIERGEYQSAPAAFDLIPLLREILGFVRDSASVKRVSVGIALEGAPLAQGDVFLVLGEERLSYPLLTNLVVNALEASPGDEEISVRLEAGECARVAIRNRGEVPQHLRDRFFEKYATSGKTTGTGLGTYSAQLFAEAQHGCVELIADEPGYTTVIVRLPLPRA